MADNKMPWEMDWGSQQEQTPMPQQASSDVQTQVPVEPWNMDWGNNTRAKTDEGTSLGVYNSDDGSILDTAKAGIVRQAQNFIAPFVDDPNLSRYQARRAQQASKEYMDESSKLGLAGNVAAGFLTYAPTIAASAFNPLVGAGMMGAATTAEALAAQQENNQDYNLDTAGAAGLGSAALDLGTFGLASRGANIARSLTSPTRRVAGELGAMGAQAATSNAGSMALINLASGRDWTEGLGEAALIGGVTGAGVHAGLKGINRALNLDTTPETTRAIDDVRDISNEAGFTPHEDFTRSVHDYTNLASNLKRDISNSSLDESATSIDALVNSGLRSPEANVVALKDAAKAARDFGMPVTSNFFNFDVNGQNAATGYLGLSARQVTRDGQNIQHATPSLFNRSKAQGAGETRESWRRDFKKGYDEAINTFQGRADANVLSVNTLLDSGANSTTGIRSQLLDLRDSLNQYQKMVSDVTERGRMPNDDVLGHYAKKIYTLGNETGTLNRLVNPITGKAGDFDPVTNLKTIKMFHDGSTSNYPQVRHGMPNVEGEKGGLFQPTVLDVAGFAAGTPWLTVGKAAKSLVGARASQRHLRGTKESGSEIVDALAREPDAFRNQAATEGDFAAGAHEAAADLNSMGINTGGAERSVPVSDSTPVTPADVTSTTTRDVENLPPTTEPIITSPWGDSPNNALVRNSINPDTLTGRSIRDHEANVEAARLANQRALEESQPTLTPEEIALNNQQRANTLSEQARVDSSRRSPAQTEEAPVVTEDAPTVSPEEIASRNAALTERARVDSARRAQGSQILEETGGVPETVRDVDFSEIDHRNMNEDGSITFTLNDGDKVLIQKGNEDKTLNAAAARRNRLASEELERRRVESESENQPTVSRGNTDSSLTTDAARMASRRNTETSDTTEAPTNVVEDVTPVTEPDSTPVTPEPVTEAPVSTRETSNVKASELARRPLQNLQETVSNMSNAERNRNPQLVNRAYQQRELLKKIDNAIDDLSTDGRNSPEDIWGIINRQGGVEALGDGDNLKTKLNSLIRKDRDEVARQAEEDSKNANSIVEDIVDTNVGKNIEEVLEKMKNNYISKNIPESVFNEAKNNVSKMFNGEISPEHVSNQVKEIMKARAKDAREKASQAEKSIAKVEKPKPVERTMQDSFDDLEGYAKRLDVWSDKEVQDRINRVTNSGDKDRKGFKALSESSERNTYNFIDDFIKDQIDAYEKALSAPNVNQHVEYANWRRKLSNLNQKRKEIKDSSEWESSKVKERERVQKEKADKAEAKLKALEEEKAAAQKSLDEAESGIKDLDEGVKEFNKSVDDTIKQASEEIKQSLDGVSDFRIQNAALEATGNVPDYVTSKYDPDFIKYKATMTAAVDTLKQRGLGRESRAIQTSLNALEKALAAKEVLPNNPEYWLSHTDIKKVKDALNGGPRGNSWYGDLYQRLRVAVYGSDKELKETFSEKVIDQKIKSALKRAEAGDVGEGGINASGVK